MKDNSLSILMVVPMFPPPVIGGLEKQAQLLSEALVKQGIKITVLTNRFDASQSYEEHGNINIFRMRTFENPVLAVLSLVINLVFYFPRLQKRVDVVHIHNISTLGFIVAALCRFYKKPYIIKLPGIGIFGVPGIAQSALGQQRIALLRKASGVVAMTVDSINELEAVGFANRKIFNVTNGIKLIDAHRPEKKNHSQVSIVFTGRLSPEKGLLEFLKVWPEIYREAGGRAVIHILGSGPQEAEIRQLIDQLNIADSVLLHGFVSNIEPYLRQADIFLLPTHGEGNSNSILEAMMFALPVITTDVGGNPVLLGDPNNRIVLAKVGDVQAMKQNVLYLICNEAERVSTGQLMRARIEQYFDINVIAGHYINVYKHISSTREDLINLKPYSSSLFS